MTVQGFLTTTEARLHRFEQMTVKTERHPSGEYSALDADNYEPGMPIGWASTEFGAIADLAEIMRERGYLCDEDEQEIERVEWKNDHERDYRKHEVLS